MVGGVFADCARGAIRITITGTAFAAAVAKCTEVDAYIVEVASAIGQTIWAVFHETAHQGRSAVPSNRRGFQFTAIPFWRAGFTAFGCEKPVGCCFSLIGVVKGGGSANVVFRIVHWSSTRAIYAIVVGPFVKAAIAIWDAAVEFSFKLGFCIKEAATPTAAVSLLLAGRCAAPCHVLGREVPPEFVADVTGGGAFWTGWIAG